MEKDELPEEFLNIKWETPPSHTNEFLSENYIQENSVTYKILNDTLTEVWSSDSDDDRKKRKKPVVVVQEGQPRLPRRLVEMYRPFSAYPRRSSLTVNQHKLYLHLMRKFSNNNSPFLNKQEQEEFHKYQNLQKKIGAEQIEYLDFLRNFAKSNVNRYSSISPDIKRYIDELWEMQLKNPLKYPRFYRPYRAVGLVLNDSKELLDLVHEREILKKGRLEILSQDRIKYRIERIYSKFVRRHPIIDDETANRERPTTFNCPVSQDQNAEVIAQRANVDFVLSSSSLKRICDNYPPFNKSWEIPVIVKELDVEENDHFVKKRIIFIDKALPKRRMTVVDKLMLYHKIAIKKFIVRYYPTELPRGGLQEDNLNRSVDQYEDFPQSGDENDHGSSVVDELNCSKTSIERPCSDAESVQLNEKSANLKEDSVEMNLTVESIDLSQHNNNADASVACMSDSDDERWVINDPKVTSETKSEKKSQNHPALCSQNTKEKAPANSEVDAENKLSNEELSKPRTRHMVKMLEELKKVGEITGMKSNNSRESMPSTTNVHPGSSNNAEAFSAEKNSVPNEDIVGGVWDKETNVGGKKLGKKRRNLLRDLHERQKKWFENSRPKSSPPRQPDDVPEEKDILSNYRPIPPPRGGNYAYRLFSLKKKDVPSPGYKLLIRCKTDAREASPGKKIATIVPKLEFQPEFGAEIVTVSEMIQDWLSIRIRPNSFLVRARINAFTSDVMMLEQKECKDFDKEETYHNMQASSCLHTLEAVLHTFHDLPPGKYIFTHEPKMGAFGNIFVATNDTGGGLYDLHEQFKVDTNAEEPQALSNLWIPIDFTMITPLYEQLRRSPGTFIPKNKQIMEKRKK